VLGERAQQPHGRRDRIALTACAGVHRCLGAHLVRMKLRIALHEWHRRIPDYALAPGHRLDYRLGGTLRYLEHLPLSWPTPSHAEGPLR
jgi:cytochrome P450